MKKSDLGLRVSEKTGLSKPKSNDLMDIIFEEITNALSRGEDVSLPGFGSFKRSHRQQRSGFNPQTGASLTIPAQTAVVFRAGKALKDAVNAEPAVNGE